ncbi:hypothetical protein ABW20_dc0108152 [Dactylellina cionopaga]|nr:hypothetical protein ABW20_dc0108152 [Dactylellina cionopaga]
MSSSKDLESSVNAIHIEKVSGKVAEHAQHADAETARYVAAPIEIDAATNKRLFWQINRRILAVMLVTYFYAHLVGQDYSWLGTILYMGILVGEYPQNFLLQKLPVAKFLSVK